MTYAFFSFLVALIILISKINDIPPSDTWEYSIVTGLVLVITVYLGIGLIMQ